MKRTLCLVVPLLLAGASCSSDTSSTPTTPAPSTAPPATAPPTTAAPTSAAPTTQPPATTEAPSTTASDSGIPHDVSFTLEDDKVEPFATADLTPSQQHAVVTGDLEGKLFGGRVHTLDTLVGLVWFEGSVQPCGAGGLAMALVKADDATVRWTVLPLMGQGALVETGGTGTVTATGDYEGTITCVDPNAAAPLRLLQPPPADGMTVAEPDTGTATTLGSYAVPSDGFQSPPMINVIPVKYDTGPLTYVQLVVPSSSATIADLTRRRVFIALVTRPDSYCGTSKPILARVTIDHFLDDNFDLSWDIVSPASGGLVGGGGSTGSKVRCP